MTLNSIESGPGRPRRRYLREPVPLYFPVEEQVPEGKVHLLLSNLLFESIERELGDHALVASNQFVYFDPSSGRRSDSRGMPKGTSSFRRLPSASKPLSPD
jgi:hypothetical protein